MLERGYALVRDAKDGRIVTDAAALQAGQSAELQLRDGRATVRVDDVRPDEPTPSDS